ncbi:hypothetical protein DU504_03185 [Haloplanus salinus]|jgi:hypothetical protein|uniref:Uncharacterized protein n=1 Tax=Haloplanus salinus TaxID=1126245 RepID=A0A368NAU1_9EURY|nr:hypothetical protein [Haloplanus salinus]RCU46399.1 hypothetical protein DU504_03185 [Haloplanus salinus]
MDSEESQQRQSVTDPDSPPVPCENCAAALRSPERSRYSFLLLDHLTTPIVGCEEHVAQFASTCGYTTDDAAKLVEHRPAGGIRCPSCQLAGYTPRQPIIPVADGAVAVHACPEHQSELLARFRTGLETQQRLTTTLDTSDRPDVL